MGAQQTSLFNGNEFNKVSYAKDLDIYPKCSSIVNVVSLKMVKEKEINSMYNTGVCDKASAIELVKHLFKGECREIAACICLDTNNLPTNISIVNTGTVTQCQVDVQYIAKLLLLSNSRGFIMVHNHPSDYLEPSPADWKLTKSLKKAMKLFNINMLDHLIVNSDCSEIESMRERIKWEA